MKSSWLSAIRNPDRRPKERLTDDSDRSATPLWWLFGLSVFLVAMPWFPSVINVLLDPSWEGAIDYLNRSDTPLGDSHFFTYGPWGHLFVTAYYGQSLWGFWLFRVIETAFLSVALVWVVKSQSGPLRLLVGVGVLVGILSARDEMTMVVAGILGLWLGSRETSWQLRLLMIGFLAALCLVKFTFALIAVAGLCAALLGHCLLGRSRTGLAVIAGFGIAFGVFWVMSGNALTAVPQWVRVSSQLAAGYPDAMSLPASKLVAGVAIAGATMLVVALLGIVFSSGSPLAAVPSMLATASMGFLVWKHGIIRAPGHTLLFFGVLPTMMAVTLALWRDPRSRGLEWLKVTLMAMGLAASLIGVTLIRPGSVSGLASRLQNRIESVLSLMLRYDDLEGAALATLAIQKEQFGLTDERILAGPSLDVLGYEQAYALLSDVSYQPRPIFQNYTVYTPELERLNRAFFQSPRAPDLLLVKVQAIDDHIEMLHDGASYLAALIDYEPIGSDRKFLIMKRRSHVEVQPEARTIADEAFGRGAWIELPAPVKGHYDRLHLDFEIPLGDRLLAFVYKPRLYSIDLRLSDGSIVTRRLNAKAAPSGFLVRPWIETTRDFLNASLGSADSRNVVAFAVRAEGEALTPSSSNSGNLRLERIAVPHVHVSPEG